MKIEITAVIIFGLFAVFFPLETIFIATIIVSTMTLVGIYIYAEATKEFIVRDSKVVSEPEFATPVTSGTMRFVEKNETFVRLLLNVNEWFYNPEKDEIVRGEAELSGFQRLLNGEILGLYWVSWFPFLGVKLGKMKISADDWIGRGEVKEKDLTDKENQGIEALRKNLTHREKVTLELLHEFQRPVLIPSITLSDGTTLHIVVIVDCRIKRPWRFKYKFNTNLVKTVDTRVESAINGWAAEQTYNQILKVKELSRGSEFSKVVVGLNRVVSEEDKNLEGEDFYGIEITGCTLVDFNGSADDMEIHKAQKAVELETRLANAKIVKAKGDAAYQVETGKAKVRVHALDVSRQVRIGVDPNVASSNNRDRDIAEALAGKDSKINTLVIGKGETGTVLPLPISDNKEDKEEKNEQS